MSSLINFFTHKFFKVLFAIYLSVFMLIWIISSPVAKHYISPVLADYHLELSDDSSIRFNPFLMRLTLSDFTLFSTKDSQHEKVFALKDFQLQVALWQLPLDRITLSKFTISDGMVKITQHDGHLVIAGVEIPSEEKPEETQDESVSEEEVIEDGALSETDIADENDNTSENSSEFAYQLVIPDFLLSQFHIEVERDTQDQKNKTHHIQINEFILNQVKVTPDNQQVNLALNALIDQTNLALTANTVLNSGLGDINSSIRLTNYPVTKLARYVDELTDLDGSFSFNSQQTITLAEASTNLRIQKAQVGLQNIIAQLAKQHLVLKDLQHNFTNLEIDLQEGAITHLAGKSSIQLTDLSFNNNDSKDKVAGFNALNLADINFILDDEPSIDIADIVLDDFIFSKKEALSNEVAQKAIAKINEISEKEGVDIAAEALVKLPPVLELKQLTLNHLHIHEKSIAINSIIFDTLTGGIIIKENKDIANLVALGDETEEVEATNEEATTADSVQNGDTETSTTTEVASVDTDDTETSETETEKETSASDESSTPVAETTSEVETEDKFIISLNELRFVNENSFDFTDFSVNPAYQRTLFLDTLTVGPLSNSDDRKEEETPFALIGRSNKYANFNLKGFLQPFATMPSYHLEGDLKEFSLLAVSTYMKESTGLEIKTGQLNLDLDVDLLGEEVDGNVVVLLEALETGLVDSEEAGNLINQGALPLNMALGMLKDGDGNVELDVPLSGTTSSPSFGLSSLVTLITKKAIMSATQDYLMTTFIPYANIVSIAISAGEFALKLRFDDLEYQVKQVEPNDAQSAYIKDFIALMQDKEDERVTICAISVPEDIDLKSGQAITDKAAIKRLVDLGEKREHAFKDYLIEHGNIQSSRILVCKPQIDSDEGAIPRIEISV